MKKNLSKIMIFLGIFSLIMGTINSFGISTAYAINLKVIGNNDGLEVVPSGTRLFDLGNLNPGDTSEEKIDIKNNYTSPFKVYMRTERKSPQPQAGEADLFNQLILTVFLDNVQIYSGPMKDYAPSNISLGNFNPNTEKELRAIVHLPGEDTGNEFQGKSLTVNWYFIAQTEEPDKPDKPDEPDKPDKPDRPDRPDKPDRPDRPTAPETPGQVTPPIEPEEPEIEEIEVEVPEAVPEEIEEEIPESLPEKPQEEKEEEEYRLIEEQIPQAQPKMPKTGQMPAFIYYAVGTALLALGIGTSRKNKE